MITLFKWQAKVLNKIYQTDIFQKIIGQFECVQQIDYHSVYQPLLTINTPPLNPKLIHEIISNSNNLCKLQTSPSHNIQPIVLNMQMYIKQLPSNYLIQHLIIFSSLSKCRIWPKMLKVSSSLVPHLIQFYKQFVKHFNQELDFKFDPVILTTKYTKIMNKIQSKRKDYPKLFQALGKEDIETIQNIVNNEGSQVLNLYVNGKEEKTITHLSIQKCSLKTNIILKQLGANFQLTDKENQTPLFYAVKRGDIQYVKFLVEEVKVDVNHQQYQNRTPLYLAAFEGNLDLVKYLYQKGADPHQESKLLRTPLSKACYLGNTNVVKYLIEIGVALEVIDSKGRTALHNAAWGVQGGREGKRRGNILLEDSPQSVKMLLKAGHRVDFPDYDGFTPLFSAVSSKAHRSMRILIQHGANLNHVTNKKQTVCFIATKYGHLSILKELIETYGCDFTAVDYKNYSPLIGSITLEAIECFQYLLEENIKIKKIIDIAMAIKCLKQFKTQQNISYLIKHINQYNEYFIQSIACVNFNQLQQQLLNQIQQNKQKQVTIFNKFITFLTKMDINSIIQKVKQLNKLQNFISFLKKLIQKATQLYNQHPYIQFINLVQYLSEFINNSIIQVTNLQIKYSTPQTDLIKLLLFDTNLTKITNIKNTLEKIAYYRMTNVLLWILTQAKFQYSNHGILKYTGLQISRLLGTFEDYSNQAKQTNNINLLQYCMINNLKDMAGIIMNKKQELNSHLSKDQLSMLASSFIKIPEYQFQQHLFTDNSNNPILKELPPKVFQFHYLTQIISKSQSNKLIQQQYKFIPNSQSYFMVDNLQLLYQVQKQIKMCHIVGVDIQHYSNSSTKQAFICLIQISTFNKVFIFDALKLPYQHLGKLVRQIYSSQLIKIMHSYDNDLRWLNEDYQVINYVNVVDTSRIYMFSLIEQQKINDQKNKIMSKSPSLKDLGQLYLNFVMNKDFQQADWRIRPLFKQMLHYSAIDAQILLPLYFSMIKNLKLQLSKQYFGIQRQIKHKNIHHILKIQYQNQQNLSKEHQV